MQDLPVVQKTFDLIKWYLPIINRLAKPYKFGLGDRMTSILLPSCSKITYGKPVRRFVATGSNLGDFPAGREYMTY